MIKKKEKPSRRQEQAAATKRKLYESAGMLFGQYDFEEVSVDDIVEASGVSKGTFYVHFDSKDALIASFLSDYISQVDTAYKSHIDSFPDETTSADMLLSLIGKIAEILTDTIGFNRLKVVYKVQLTNAINMEVVKGYNRDLYKTFAFVLGRGIERGEFHSDLSLDALTKHFMMAMRGLCYEWCIRYPDFDLKGEAIAHFGILLSGLR